MDRIQKSIAILTRRQDVVPLIESVRTTADSDRDALGFYADSIYREYAIKGNLFVAASSYEGIYSYAGHLLFDLRQPRAKVLQLFVAPSFRRLGIGARLVEELKRYLAELQYLSIQARVAEDLTESNLFWEDQGFHVQRLEPGGASRGKRRRVIVVRSHELASPQLFGASGISSANPFGLDFAAGAERPTYLLDMNVLFDLGPRRHRRADVVNLFRAERMQICNLAISSEIQEELKRTCPAGKTDPMQDFASILPTYAVPNDQQASQLAEELAAIVFDERSQRNALTANDKSDLRHLATAIFHGLSGLVTSDTTILDAAATLRSRYGIDVLSPATFSLQETHPIDITAFGTEPDRILTLNEASRADELDIRALLSKCGVPHSQQQAEWGAVGNAGQTRLRYIVRSGGSILGYLTWHHTIGQKCINAMLAIEEKSSAAIDGARLMLSKLNEQIAPQDIAVIRLGFPASQSLIRSEAHSLGFTGGANNCAQLKRIVIKGVITGNNWQSRREALFAASGVRLPSNAPIFRNINQHIEVYTPDGNKTHLPLLKLESMLAPALFCMDGRHGVITPVRRQFSEHLLQHLTQGSLLPQPRVQLYQQRHYLSHPKTLRKFSPGCLMFFYESRTNGGLGGVIAVGRVVRSYLQNRGAIGHAELDASVFDPDQLESIGKTDVRTVTVFDNLNILPNPVYGDTLKELGCGTPVKLLSTQSINSEQAARILAKAYRYESE